MPDKLTIQDIVWFTGVSKATFSRVLNHNPSVKSLLRERVHLVVWASSGALWSLSIGL